MVDDYIFCPCCGQKVAIPDDTLEAAKHWKRRLDIEAARKRDRRSTDKKYCQIKKSKETSSK